MVTTTLKVLPRKTGPSQEIKDLSIGLANKNKAKDNYISNLTTNSATPPTPQTSYNRNDEFRQKLAGIEEQAMYIQDILNKRRDSERQQASGSGPSNSLREMSSALSPRTEIPDFYKPARTAMERYIESLNPTKQEEMIGKNISNLRSSISGGIQQASEQAIPMGFITGQQQAIENRGLNALQPFESELERLIAQRQATSEGLGARQVFETSMGDVNLENFLLEDEIARDERRYAYDVAQDASAPIEFGGSLYQRNPDGGFTEILSAPPEAPEPFELSEGQSRYAFNPETGQYEEVASKGKTYKPTTGDTTSEITQNRVDQILDGFITLDDLSVSERQKVQDELYKMGLGSNTPPAWFRDYYQAEERQPMAGQGVYSFPLLDAVRGTQQPKTVNQAWSEYRKKVMSDKKASSSEIDFDEL